MGAGVKYKANVAIKRVDLPVRMHMHKLCIIELEGHGAGEGSTYAWLMTQQEMIGRDWDGRGRE